MGFKRPLYMVILALKLSKELQALIIYCKAYLFYREMSSLESFYFLSILLIIYSNTPRVSPDLMMLVRGISGEILTTSFSRAKSLPVNYLNWS